MRPVFKLSTQLRRFASVAAPVIGGRSRHASKNAPPHGNTCTGRPVLPRPGHMARLINRVSLRLRSSESTRSIERVGLAGKHALLSPRDHFTTSLHPDHFTSSLPLFTSPLFATYHPSLSATYHPPSATYHPPLSATYHPPSATYHPPLPFPSPSLFFFFFLSLKREEKRRVERGRGRGEGGDK